MKSKTEKAMTADYFARTTATSEENAKACRIVDTKTGELVLFVRFSETPTQFDIKEAITNIFIEEALPTTLIHAAIRQVECNVTFTLDLSKSGIRWS